MGQTLEFIWKHRKPEEPSAESAWQRQLLRTPSDSSLGRRNSMRVDEGRKGWSLLAINMKARTAAVDRGEKSLPSDPGSELHLGSFKDEKNEQKNKPLLSSFPCGLPLPIVWLACVSPS